MESTIHMAAAITNKSINILVLLLCKACEQWQAKVFSLRLENAESHPRTRNHNGFKEVMRRMGIWGLFMKSTSINPLFMHAGKIRRVQINNSIRMHNAAYA